LSEDEITILNEFREAIKEDIADEEERAWLDDNCLCRYLRARNWELEKSLEMIRKTLEWRREYKPHKIVAKDIEIELKNDGKMYRHGFDKHGQPIVYMKPGKDNTGVPEKEWKVKYLVYIMEKCAKSIKPSTGAEKLVWLIDFSNYSTMGGIPMAKISKEIVDILQNHYPERLGAAYIMNAPFMFEVFWKMISPFVDPITKQKVSLMSKDFSKLHENVDLDQLEKEYGGTDSFVYNFEEHMAFEMLSDPK